MDGARESEPKKTGMTLGLDRTEPLDLTTWGGEPAAAGNPVPAVPTQCPWAGPLVWEQVSPAGQLVAVHGATHTPSMPQTSGGGHAASP